MFTDIFLDEMMTYLRIASNQFRGLWNERGFRKKQGDHDLQLVKHSLCVYVLVVVRAGVADFILLYILCVFETFHNNKVFKILSSTYV